jgi:hypothetical protein
LAVVADLHHFGTNQKYRGDVCLYSHDGTVLSYDRYGIGGVIVDAWSNLGCEGFYGSALEE